ncbi:MULTISPECIES: type IV secretory system conjugative DNA transfer family protein [unclassified Arcicella]|uniref:type IV secretory system conjugative DNA transfer family protein n=1 Tax=unclassified Arcicella TaxID=2644986 RepID=UPI002857594E|nr:MULTISPECIES: type IV secretory system conjugative DNA transfer family protein [unclassified Arcicella]MDR6561277.1 type IV secretion system protein VirD4 [Arcicella sp. BE51]MDR6811161.1 type IV secretion system protein VirD4 [Arcicella sp. BE140]MDR6822511.1 type IV secretion system protein VirD4 [Arcicella sp. BE139]
MTRIDQFFRNLAIPFVFLWKVGALSILVSLLLCLYGYKTFFQIEASSFKELVASFFSYEDIISFFTRMVLLTIIVLFFSLLFTKTPLNGLNKEFINAISSLILFTLIIYFLPILVPMVIGIVVLLLLLWKGYRGDEMEDYDYTFNPYGDSRWANDYDLSKANFLPKTTLNQPPSFILGRTIDSNQSIKFEGEGHMITIAKTGSGKGTGVVIPNLFVYSGTSIIFDPKGENFIKTFYHRGEGVLKQDIVLVDPFMEVSKQLKKMIARLEALPEKTENVENSKAITFFKETLKKVSNYHPNHYLSSLNPMQVINRMYKESRYDEIFDEANVLADMMVVKSGNESDPHWNEKAKSFIRGAILYVVFSDEYKDRSNNLLTVRECIFSIFKNKENLEITIQECQENNYLKGVAGEFSLIAGDERNSVLSNVLRHTEFLDSPLVAKSLSEDGVELNDLKDSQKSIYLVLPASKLFAYSRLARLWISCIIQSLSNETSYSKNRVLFMLDEMAQLGYMEPLIQAVSLMRGYGMNLWMIFQDIPQIKSIYNEKWQTFIANCKIQQYFGITDNETAEYVSKLTGQTTMTLRSDTDSTGSSKSNSSWGTSKGSSQTISSAAKPLIYPDQIRRIDFQIIIADDLYPIRAKKIRYYEESEKPYFKLYPFKMPVLTD